MQHLDVLKSYFRWPTFVVTALVAVLVYMTVPLLPAYVVTIILWILLITPTTITMWGHRRSVDSQTSSGPIVFKYMQRIGGLFLHIMQVVLLNTRTPIFFNYKAEAYSQSQLTLSIIIGLLMILYTVSFIQLFKEKFTLKIA